MGLPVDICVFVRFNEDIERAFTTVKEEYFEDDTKAKVHPFIEKGSV